MKNQLLDRFQRCDQRKIVLSPGQVRLFTCIRNEVARVPFFLDYYRLKGINTFFFVDNGSTDGTVELLVSQPDTYVFRTEESYAVADYGISWFECLLRKYGVGAWCIIADSDELLMCPHAENITFPDLCRFLDRERANALRVTMLDMYGKGFPALENRSREKLWEIFPYFDGEISWRDDSAVGGVRERVFGVSPLLYKMPLIKYQTEQVLHLGMHYVSNVQPSCLHGVLLHFKYDSQFAEKARIEAARKEHWSEGAEYKGYARAFDENPGLSMFSPEHSVAYKNSQQLVAMGLMNTSKPFDRFASSLCRPASRRKHNLSQSSPDSLRKRPNPSNPQSKRKNDMEISANKVERVLKKVFQDKALRPSGVVSGKIDKYGLALQVQIPRRHLTPGTMRQVLALVMSDMLQYGK